MAFAAVAVVAVHNLRDIPLTITHTIIRKRIMMNSIPNRPAITNVLIKASANIVFRTKLLTNPQAALAEMNLSPEDIEVLADVEAQNLPEYARQVKIKLMAYRT